MGDPHLIRFVGKRKAAVGKQNVYVWGPRAHAETNIEDIVRFVHQVRSP